jgi:hypothetical protein
VNAAPEPWRIQIVIYPLEWTLWPILEYSWRLERILYVIRLGPIAIYPHGR